MIVICVKITDGRIVIIIGATADVGIGKWFRNGAIVIVIVINIC